MVNPKSSCADGLPPALTSESGYLASHVTQQTECGSGARPWRIRAEEGKTIKLFLYDFEALKRKSETVHAVHAVCQMYATIRETGRRRQSVCGQQQRKSLVYSSLTNDIEVLINVRASGEDKTPWHFVIYYEGNT